jgi:chromosomal replication initiation ATPase DnaA
MAQTSFTFEPNHDYSPENFLVAASNQTAYDLVKAYPWDYAGLNIYGPKASGKTYLANILNEVSHGEAVIIEDVTAQHNETELFHSLNLAKDQNKKILITSLVPLAQIGFKLPDLVSRVSALNAVEITTPDNQLFYVLFARLFSARQLKVSDDVINYLVTRVERSFKAAHDAVEKIDKLSLDQKRNITIPLVRNVI